jgi:hypothetical protein
MTLGPSGKVVRAPGGYGLLHDPSGRDWAKCSGLVIPFETGGDEIDDNAARQYLGYPAREGQVILPPKALSAWKRIGPALEIFYFRRRPGRLPSIHRDQYYHPFKGAATVYRRGRIFRVELGPGCEWNVRGIVKP